MNILYRNTPSDDFDLLATLLTWGLSQVSEGDTFASTVAILQLPNGTIISKAITEIIIYGSDIVVYFATVLGTGIYSQYLNKTPDQILEIIQPDMDMGQTVEIVNPNNLTVELSYTNPIS